MVRNYKNKSKRRAQKPRNKRRRNARRQPKVNKATKTLLNNMILKKMDQQIEDKYILDTGFHNHNDNFDAGTKSMVVNVSPAILNGDEVNQRTGNKVRLKYLRTFFRYLPGKGGQHGVIDSSSPTYSGNWFGDIPDATVYLLKINSQMIQTMSAADLRVACNAKFRSAGHCWQDYAQSTGQQANSAIKLLDKFTMQSKYRSVVCPFTPLNATGTFAAGPPETQTIVPTYQASCTLVQVPQYSYYNLLCSKLAQKIEIEDVHNRPIKYQYWYFIQLGSGYNNNSYDPIIKPEDFSTRNVWVFEDA